MEPRFGHGGGIRRITWSLAFGIPQRHWRIFRECAVRHGVYILLRPGPSSTIAWIERDCPVVPAELTPIGVDEASGLLVARDAAARERAFAFGHYVLAPVVTGSPESGLVAVNPRQRPLAAVYRERWARAGVVIDRRTYRPFTAGYELVAVMDDEGSGRFAELARRELAERIGRDRIHYTVFRSSPAKGGPGGQVPAKAGRSPEVIAFAPRGEVYACAAGPAARTRDVVAALRAREAAG